MDHVHFSALTSEAITPTTPEDLFTAAYRKYAPMVRAIIFTKLDNHDFRLAEDLTQDTFLALFRYRDSVDMTRDLGALLRVMGRQAIGRHFRKMRNTREVAVDTSHWSYANRHLVTSEGGYCKVITGANPDETAPGDSDPDMDEALRRIRTPRALAGAR